MLQDIFDGKFKADLDTIDSTTVWSAVGGNLKDAMMAALKNSLKASKLQVQ